MIRLDDIHLHARITPDKAAVVDGEHRVTWLQFEERVHRVATSLGERLPARRPARAVFLADNSWELMVAMAACASLGVPVIGLDYTNSPEGAAAALDALQPTVVFSTAAHRPLLYRAGWPGENEVLHIHMDREITGDAMTGVNFGELLARQPGAFQPVDQPFESVGFTSGTSGLPKMVIRTKSFEARRLADLVDQFGFSSDDVHLLTVPLYHASGPGWARIFLALGGTVVLSPYEDAGTMARLISEEGVSTTLMVPPVLHRLIAHPDSEFLYRTGRLKFVLSGGRHLNRWVINTAWERLGPVLHLYYGTTETGLNTIIGPDELHVAPCRTGRPMPGHTIAILDQEGRPLASGQRGRIAIASYQLMDRYASGEADFLNIDLGDGKGEQRFLVTSDSGVIDSEGRLELTGRSDGVARMEAGRPLDVNIFGLESDLLDLPCVKDTAVMRVNLPGFGDALVVPFMAVSLDRLASGLRAVQAACARRVPCLPSFVVPVDRIPYSPTGKARSRQLLEMVMSAVNLEVELRKETQKQKEMSA